MKNNETIFEPVGPVTYVWAINGEQKTTISGLFVENRYEVRMPPRECTFEVVGEHRDEAGQVHKHVRLEPLDQRTDCPQ